MEEEQLDGQISLFDNEPDVLKKYEQDPDSITLEEAKQIINSLEFKVASLNKSVKSAYEQAHNTEKKLLELKNSVITELNSLNDQLKICYKMSLLEINNIKGGIYNGD